MPQSRHRSIRGLTQDMLLSCTHAHSLQGIRHSERTICRTFYGNLEFFEENHPHPSIYIYPHIIIHIIIYPVPVGCTVSKLCIHPARVNMTCASCAMNKPHPQSLQRVRYFTYPDHLTWIAILHRSAMFEHELKPRDI